MTTDSAAAMLVRTLPGASRAAPRCSTWLLAAAATATPFATLREDLSVTLLDYPNVLHTSRANARALGLDLPAAERAGRVAFIEVRPSRPSSRGLTRRSSCLNFLHHFTLRD